MMKKSFILSVAAVVSFVMMSFASNIDFATNMNNEVMAEAATANNVQKWNITADVWMISEGQWYQYPQLITICYDSNIGYYMWSYGGIRTSVYRSDKRGYDFMVNSNSHRNWRFYFRRSDLR